MGILRIVFSDSWNADMLPNVSAAILHPEANLKEVMESRHPRALKTREFSRPVSDSLFLDFLTGEKTGFH